MASMIVRGKKINTSEPVYILSARMADTAGKSQKTVKPDKTL